jgi:hypothetical protein
MDAFSYLSVLLSIILGLAITQVLQGVRGLLLARRHVIMFWPSVLWAGTILAIATQLWWASFGLAGHNVWTFLMFGMVLVQTILLYMLAALVLPDFAQGEPQDLPAHYFREATPFFATLLAMLVASLLKDWVIDGHFTDAENLMFHALFASIAVSALVWRQVWLHKLLSVAAAVLLAVYISLLFAQL